MIKTAALTFSALVLAGCASTTPYSPVHPVSEPVSDPFLQAVQAGTDDLVRQLARHPGGAPVIVASAQNNDRLSQVCQHGRLVSDFVSSRLIQHGIPVTEIRLAQQLRINGEGETVLSRDLDQLAKSTKADTVVTATWSTIAATRAAVVANDAGGYGSASQYGRTYVTLKAIRLSDGRVLSSHTLASPVSWSC